MKENRTHHYEAMFLLRQAAAADLGAAVDHIKDVLQRAEAEIVAMKKWDERRLAYEIKKQKRGTYILVYAAIPAAQMASLERMLNLSEVVLRWMLVRADHLSIDEMKSADAQQELADEIKLRAERGRDRDDAEDTEDSEAQAAAAEA